MPSGTNNGNKLRAIGTNTHPEKFDTEGTDARGRYTIIVKNEYPSRIDEVNNELYYIGWAEAGVEETDSVWKIKRIRLVGSVWFQEYAYGEEYFRYKWSDRTTLPYF